MKTEANVWENSKADQWKPKTQLRVFTCSRILTNFAEEANSSLGYPRLEVSIPVALSADVLSIVPENEKKTRNE